MKLANNEIAIEKLKRELKESKDKRVPAGPIVKHLIFKCKEDEGFTKRVELKEKTLKSCFNYVFNEVKKKLNGVSGWITDNEVYKMAETYWLLNITELKDIEIKETHKASKVVKYAPPKEEVKEVKEVLEDKQVSIFDIV